MRGPCKEAVEDGIPYEKDDETGILSYYPPCSICGAPAKSPVYFRGSEFSCQLCRARMMAIKCHLTYDRSVMEKEEKLKNALTRISRVADVSLYDEAVEKVRKGFYRKNHYQSTEEIMVALELLRKGFTIYHQFEVDSYRVDFLIPQLSVVLEVDGEIYHRSDSMSRARAEMRDCIIEEHLGEGYKVIHIPTRYINRNVRKLVPAIKALANKKCVVKYS